MLDGMRNFGTPKVVVERVGRQGVVVNHLSAEIDERDALVFPWLLMGLDIVYKVGPFVDDLQQMLVVDLQLSIEYLRLALLFTIVLEHDETGDHGPGEGQQHQEKPVVVGESNSGSHNQSLNE